MNEYTFEFHRIDEALIFVKTIQATLELNEFSINGMCTERTPYPEKWSVKVWLKTNLSIDSIKKTCKMLCFYDAIGFGGE